jgi:DNA-binding MarR family transcriptional regulator
MEAPEIEKKLEITSRQRDTLQQRFVYHVEKFKNSLDGWESCGPYLNIDNCFGLTPNEVKELKATLTNLKYTGTQVPLDKMSQHLSDGASLRELIDLFGLTKAQVTKKVAMILEAASLIRKESSKTAKAPQEAP